MIIANRPLNSQAIALEEAEAEIRKTVRAEYMKGTPRPRINDKVVRIIETALKQVKIPNLQKAAKLSLVRFYNRQYKELSLLSPTTLEIITVTGLLLSHSIKADNGRVTALRAKGFFFNKNGLVDVPKANLYGVPMQKFSKDYFEENVKPVFERLKKQQSLDPHDIRGVNTLRNLAEMEVRYNDHLQQIEDLKAAGNKLVIASSHADCSDRCRPWQGRVFSLDGTSGKTDDGRDYVPLEKATDVFYTTKAGKTYKNGLLGFSCRHYLVPYKSGYRFPKPDAKEERKQYDITLKQRAYEREVRKWRDEALEYQGVDDKRYNYAKAKADEWNKEYINFSRENKRAYYPSRTKIL